MSRNIFQITRLILLTESVVRFIHQASYMNGRITIMVRCLLLGRYMMSLSQISNSIHSSIPRQLHRQPLLPLTALGRLAPQPRSLSPRVDIHTIFLKQNRSMNPHNLHPISGVISQITLVGLWMESINYVDGRKQNLLKYDYG